MGASLASGNAKREHDYFAKAIAAMARGSTIRSRLPPYISSTRRLTPASTTRKIVAMIRVALVSITLLLVIGGASKDVSATNLVSRYHTKVVAQSPNGRHPTYNNGTFWLGDYLWLAFRDGSLGPGVLRKFRVCWTYQSFPGGGCKNGLAGHGWQIPPRIKARFNSNLTATWFVGGVPVARRQLRITGE
jgi:hypothetical protein